MRQFFERSGVGLGQVLLTVTSIVSLLTFAWRGWYARYLTDDYCTSSLIRDIGFFQAMHHHRQNWSGRFSYFPAKGLLEMVGPVTAQLTPSLMIVLLVGATLLAAHLFVREASRLTKVTATLIFVLAYVAGAPSLTNIGGALYWETGSVTYTTPLILFVLWAALFPARMKTGVTLLASAALMFVAGGMSETSLAAQGAMTGAALLVALLARDPRAIRIAATGLIASIAALAVVATAPGNVVRAQVDVASRTPAESIERCFVLANDFIGTYVFAGGLPLLPLIIVAMTMGALVRPLPARRAAGITLVALTGYLVSFLPSAWLLYAGPPERALDVSNFFVIVAVGASAWGAGSARRWRTAILATLLLAAVVVPVLVVRDNLGALPHARYIAARMDETDAVLKQKTGERVSLRAPWAVSQRIFDTDPTHWSNVCVSRFYRLESFHATR